MNVTKLGRAPFYTVIFYVLFCSFITVQEYFTAMSADDYKIMVIARIFILGSAIPVGFFLRKNPFSFWANSFIGMNFLVYTLVGHYYQPLYYACFMQAMICFSVLFFTTPLHHFVISTVKVATYIAFYLLTYDIVKYQHGSETHADFVMTILVCYGLSCLLHHLFTAERGLREAANERFALMGRHASNIVHDIKGSIGIPQLYLQQAQQSLGQHDYEKTSALLEEMQKSLTSAEKTIFDLNQLSRLTEGANQTFKSSEALHDVLGILKKRLHEIEIQISGDLDVQGNRGIVCSVFLNLISNSLESFRRSKTTDPRIEIKMDARNKSISFLDNGGGFDPHTLTALRKNQMTHLETSNSGLGLYLVRENLRAIGGKIFFENQDQGAKVEVRLS